MIRNTFLSCGVCGAKILWVTQNGNSVEATPAEGRVAFVESHIASCRGGRKPAPGDAGFKTEMRDGKGQLIESALSGVAVAVRNSDA